MAEIMSVPLKKASDIDITKPLKNLISSTFSTADQPVDCSDAISDLQKLRNAAIKAQDRSEASLEAMMKYYDQLVSLEMKIPTAEVQIPFKWKDAFDKGGIFGGRISLTVPSIGYEKVSHHHVILTQGLQYHVLGLHPVQHRRHEHHDRRVTEHRQ